MLHHFSFSNVYYSYIRCDMKYLSAYTMQYAMPVCWAAIL